ncbi:hypothetical protein FPOAC2_07330 [Fusarium poae]
MKAVVFNGPFDVSVEERPIPQIRDPRDIIVKVNMTALCGSELHLFRGVEPTEPNFIMGHEFTGTVVEIGSAVKSVQIGDKVVSPFTASWMRPNSVPSRLEQAAKLGAEPLNFMNDKAGMQDRIKSATGGRGADIVVEVVGLSPALRTAFDLVRPFGAISSIGVHNGEIPWSGNDAYNKNIRLQMGRCPVRSIFEEAMDVLKGEQDSLGFLFDNIMPLSDAVRGYDLFNQSQVQKVVFEV